MYISFNTAVIAFESDFSEHICATLTNLAFVTFLFNSGFQYKLGTFLFISVTSRSNLLTRNDILSYTISSTDLYIYVNMHTCLYICKMYMEEGFKKLSNHSMYIDVKIFNEILLPEFTGKSNKIFKSLCNMKIITEKDLKYFSYSFKIAICLGKMYVLSTIKQRLDDGSGSG